MLVTGDSHAAVRWAALRTLARVLQSVRSLPHSELQIFSEYILPSLSMLPSDAEESVRVEYAAIQGHLAAAASSQGLGVGFSLAQTR